MVRPSGPRWRQASGRGGSARGRRAPAGRRGSARSAGPRRPYQEGRHLPVVLRGAGRPLLQAAQVEGRVVAPAAATGPADGGQPVAPLPQGPDVGGAAQVPAQLQETGRVLLHSAPPLAQLGGGRQALRWQRRGRAAARRRPAPRHQQQDPRLLEGLPDSADAEGDLPRQRRAQPRPVGGEERGPAAAGGRRPDGTQPAPRRVGQQPQPLGGEVRRLHQPPREDVGAGHEAAAGAALQQQHLVVRGAGRGARRPPRRARRQQQRRRFLPVPQPRVHLEVRRRRRPPPPPSCGAARPPGGGTAGGGGRAGEGRARPCPARPAPGPGQRRGGKQGGRAAQGVGPGRP